MQYSEFKRNFVLKSYKILLFWPQIIWLPSLLSRSISAFEAISFGVFLACDYAAEASFVVASNDIIVE